MYPVTAGGGAEMPLCLQNTVRAKELVGFCLAAVSVGQRNGEYFYLHAILLFFASAILFLPFARRRFCGLPFNGSPQ